MAPKPSILSGKAPQSASTLSSTILSLFKENVKSIPNQDAATFSLFEIFRNWDKLSMEPETIKMKCFIIVGAGNNSFVAVTATLLNEKT